MVRIQAAELVVSSDGETGKRKGLKILQANHLCRFDSDSEHFMQFTRTCGVCKETYVYSPFYQHVCYLRKLLSEVIESALGYKELDGMKIYHHATEPLDV